MPNRLLPLRQPREDPLPWVAPKPVSDADRPQVPLCQKPPPLPPPLPRVGSLPTSPLPPPPLVRSSSHPTSRALSFALPGTALPKTGLGGPDGWSPRLMDQMAAPPWTARLMTLGPRQVLPALGALPGLFGGVRQMGAALGWQALLMDRRRACLADVRQLTGGMTELGPDAPAPICRLLAGRQATLARESVALTQAIWEARYKIATLALELCSIATTAVPQLHDLLGLGFAPQGMQAMRSLLPWCMLGHGFLGMAHAAWKVWHLRQAEPEATWPQYRCHLHQAALQYQKMQLMLWSTFTVSLWGLVLFPAATGLAPAACGAALMLSILGLAVQHLYAAEHDDAPRALWIEPSWNSHAFSAASSRETSHGLLLSQQQFLHDGLTGLVQDLSPLRRALLMGLFALSSVHLCQYLFICCARAWLGHRHKELWAVIDEACWRQETGLCRLWAAQSWELNRELRRAQGQMARWKHSRTPLAASVQSVLDRALTLGQRDVSVFAHEAKRHSDAMGSARRTAYSKSLRVELAQAPHLPPADRARLGPSVLLAQKINCDQMQRALAWAGHLGLD